VILGRIHHIHTTAQHGHHIPTRREYPLMAGGIDAARGPYGVGRRGPTTPSMMEQLQSSTREPQMGGS
jgi:hypothetical protein